MKSSGLYVNVDIARQLRSIGFDESCHMVWKTDTGEQELLAKPMTGQHLDGNTLLSPTKQQVIDWFVEKHGLLPLPDYGYFDRFIDGSVERFFYSVSVVELEKLDSHGDVLTHHDNGMYDNHKEAIDRGIDMCIGIVFERMAENTGKVV